MIEPTLRAMWYTTPVLSFYKEMMFLRLIELFQIQHPKTAQTM